MKNVYSGANWSFIIGIPNKLLETDPWGLASAVTHWLLLHIQSPLHQSGPFPSVEVILVVVVEVIVVVVVEIIVVVVVVIAVVGVIVVVVRVEAQSWQDDASWFPQLTFSLERMPK